MRPAEPDFTFCQQSPASLQLRYLQTLLELGADQNSTVVFPLPVDIIGPFLNKLVAGGPETAAQQSPNGATPHPD